MNNYTSNYTFIVEEGSQVSLPIDKGMFKAIMQDKIEKWGMVQVSEWMRRIALNAFRITASHIHTCGDEAGMRS